MGEGLIGEILNRYGVWGIVMMLSVLVILPLSLKYIGNILIDVCVKFREEKEELEDSESASSISLRDHLFFTNAKFKLRFDIPTIQMNEGDAALQQAYRDLMYMNVESLYYGCKNISKIHNIESLTPTQWDALVKQELTSILNAFEQKAEDFGMPKSILNRYIRWFLTYNDLLTEFISQISGNDYYGDNISRTNTLFLIMNLLMISMIGDVTKLFDETKNDFAGVEYRGSVIEV